jgi:hypothetical protein
VSPLHLPCQIQHYVDSSLIFTTLLLIDSSLQALSSCLLLCFILQHLKGFPYAQRLHTMSHACIMLIKVYEQTDAAADNLFITEGWVLMLLFQRCIPSSSNLLNLTHGKKKSWNILCTSSERPGTVWKKGSQWYSKLIRCSQWWSWVGKVTYYIL